MSEMIERLAASQAEFDGRTLGGMPRPERERYMERARLFLRDLLSPTEAMLWAAESDHETACSMDDANDHGIIRRSWPLMINAALNAKDRPTTREGSRAQV